MIFCNGFKSVALALPTALGVHRGVIIAFVFTHVFWNPLKKLHLLLIALYCCDSAASVWRTMRSI